MSGFSRIHSMDRGVPAWRDLRFAAVLLLLLVLLLLIAAPRLQAQVPTAPIAPNRYIVVYRNRTIPVDAESRTRIAGARLLHRDERLGIASVTSAEPIAERGPVHARTSSAAQSDAATMRSLAAQPNVDYVLHDRIVTANRLSLQRVVPATFSVIIGSTTHPGSYDSFYTSSPQ